MGTLRSVIWSVLLLAQGLDVYTTSRIGVEHEGNPLVALLWTTFGFLGATAFKVVGIAGCAGFHWFLVQYQPQGEKYFMVGLVAVTVLLVLVVANNFWALRVLRLRG